MQVLYLGQGSTTTTTTTTSTTAVAAPTTTTNTTTTVAAAATTTTATDLFIFHNFVKICGCRCIWDLKFEEYWEECDQLSDTRYYTALH